MAKDVIITPADGDIQFENTTGTEAGKIEQSGDDLVLSNAVGDILIGDGTSDVYIGDGAANVDIVFEQNGSIRGEAGSSVDITLGSSDTDVIISGSTFNIDPDASFSGLINANNKLTFTTSNGYVLFDHQPQAGVGEYTSEVPLLKIDYDGSEKTILSRTSGGGAITIGADDSVVIAGGDTKAVIKTNLNLGAENVIFSSETGFHAYGFPNNSTVWANRQEFRFYTGGTDTSLNGLWIGDGGNTQFIDLNRNLKNIGTINSGEITTNSKIVTTAGGSLLRKYVSTWTNATTHDLLYQGWHTNTDDYIYLKSPGNSTTNHGVAFISDNVIAFGRTDVETGAPELTSAAAPISENWFVLNSTSATFSGNVSLTGGSLSISGDGSNAVTFTETGAGKMTVSAADDIILDAGSDIVLDAGGDDLRLKVSGTEYAKFNNSSSNLNIFSSIQDKSIKFIGNDNGTEITALTLNMADGGDANFLGTVTSPTFLGDLNGTINTATTGTTQTAGNNSTLIATTAYADAAAGAVPIGNYLPLAGGTLTGNLTVDIDDGGSAPAMTNTLRLKGYGGRGAGIKIQDSVNSATSPSSREWFIGSGYNNSGFNIGYASDGVQSSYNAQSIFNIATNGNATFAGDVSLTGGSLSITSDGSNAVTFTESGNGDFTIDAPDDIRVDAGGGDIVLRKAGTEYGRISMDSSDLKITTSITNRDILMIPNGTGNVGIGTTNPGVKLQVGENTSGLTGTASIFQEGGAEVGLYVKARVNRASLLVADNDTGVYISAEGGKGSFGRTQGVSTANINIDGSGNVGIGTITPQKKLDVYLGTNDAVASIGGTISAGEYAGLHFGYSETGNALYRHSAIVFERDDGAFGDARGKIHLLNSSGGSASAVLGDARLTILPTGNIGIGTTSPSSKLEVYASGSTVLDIQGSQGQLFSITDDLTGDLFTVSDISGVPIFNINASGTSNFDGNLNLGDNNKIQLGASQDLQIYHDGSNSYIKNAGTGDLIIDSGTLKLRNAAGVKTLIEASSTAVELYHNNVKKLHTTTTGVTVTGELEATSLDINGNADISGNITMAANATVDGVDISALPTTFAPTNAEQNVQSDWNATSGDALILNKPTIPTDHGDHDGLYLPIGGGTLTGNLNIPEYLYHAGDTNTYLRFREDDLQLVAGGRNIIRMDEGTDPDKVQLGDSSTVTYTEGSVGIGITSPATLLHTATPATGTAAVNNELRIQSTHASGYGGKAIVNLLTSQYGNSGIYMGDNATFSSQPSYIEHVDSSNMLKYKSTGNHSMLVGTATKMSIGSSTTYFSGNNVGIGTTSPSHQLEVGLSSSVSLANQPAIPLMVSNDGNSVDGRVFIQVKNDVVNTASAIGAGIKMTAANVTSGTAAYDSSLIFLQSKSPGNQTIHSAPQNIKFYVDNDGTTAGEGTGYNNYGDLAFELQTDGEAIFNYNVGIGTTTPSSKLEVYRDSSSYVANFADTDTRASLKLRSSSNGDGQITFSQGASASSIIQTSNVLATTPRNLHLNPFGGNVSIGTTTPSSTKKLDVAGNIQTEIIEYKKPDALNQFRGEVVTFGSQSGIAQGDVVVLNTSGQWVKAQANSGTTSKSLLGVAMGTTAAAGILVRGFVRCSATFSQSLNAGNPFYLSATTSGDATGTIPTTTGHIARIVGYATGVTAEMYFCPDNTFVEIA